jgi:transposase-like protein
MYAEVAETKLQGGRSMSKIPQSCPPVNAQSEFEALLLDAENTLRRAIEVRLTALLVAIVCHVLGRRYHRRRKNVSWRLHRQGRCSRCGTSASNRFTRNGFRERHLLTLWGVITIYLPRVRCVCGGSVRIDFGGLLRPYQRISNDVDAQIQRWGALALSLREMRHELDHLRIGPLSLRALNQRLHQLIHLDAGRTADEVPPILQVDAIWVTQLRPNGKVRHDRKGRKRAVKGRFKCPVFVAMGVWPESNRSEILLWQLGSSEDEDQWIAFLSILEEQGIRGENGLRLIIHDGGSGLCAALRTVYFGAESQRCLFHKLRNLYNAIQVPEGLSAKQGRRYRKVVFKDFHAIWQAQRYDTVLRRYQKAIRKYRDSQPKAVATLRRDFRATVTYYHIEQQYPGWERRHLRTTSRLERFNRRIRRRARAANAYHSDRGLLAMIAQEAYQFHAAQQED